MDAPRTKKRCGRNPCRRKTYYSCNSVVYVCMYARYLYITLLFAAVCIIHNAVLVGEQKKRNDTPARSIHHKMILLIKEQGVYIGVL